MKGGGGWNSPVEKKEHDLSKCYVCGNSAMGCKETVNTSYGITHKECYPFNPNLVEAQRNAESKSNDPNQGRETKTGERL